MTDAPKQDCVDINRKTSIDAIVEEICENAGSWDAPQSILRAAAELIYAARNGL